MSKKQELTTSSDHAALDEFELAEKLGFDLTLTEGSEQLSKLTYPQDFERLERLLFDWETRTDLVTTCSLKMVRRYFCAVLKFLMKRNLRDIRMRMLLARADRCDSRCPRGW